MEGREEAEEMAGLKGRRGRGTLKKGRKRKGLVMWGWWGGGEEIEPELE